MAAHFTVNLSLAQAQLHDLQPRSSTSYEIRMSGLCGGRRHPAVEPPPEVYSRDRSALVASEEAGLPLQTATRDDVLVIVAGQQAHVGRRVVGGHFGVRCRTDLRFDPSLDRQPCPVPADGESLGVGLVPSDDLLGTRRIKGEWFWIAVAEPDVVLIPISLLCGKIEERNRCSYTMWKGMNITHGTSNHASGLA